MDVTRITFRVTLELDKKWAGNMNKDELVEYIEARLSSSLGFKGQGKKLKVVSQL